MRERDSRFGQADKFDCLLRGYRERQSFGVCESDVFTRENDNATRDKTKIFTGVEHFREPIHCAFLIGSAHTLNKRADRVVVRVAGAVIHDRFLLNAFFRDRDCKTDHAFRIRRSREHANLKRIQTFPRVAIAQLC